MQRNPKLPAIHPIHEGEEQDPTCEEAEQDNDAVDPVESGVVETQLDMKHRKMVRGLP